MSKQLWWVFIDVILMISNYHNYKTTERKINLIFVIIFTILAIQTLVGINLGWY